MRQCIAFSGFLAGLFLGAAAPGLVGCWNCRYPEPVERTYTITEAPTLPAAVGGTVEVSGGPEWPGTSLLVRYEQDGREIVIAYRIGG